MTTVCRKKPDRYFCIKYKNITYFYGKLPQNFYDRNFTTQNLTKKVRHVTIEIRNFWVNLPDQNFSVDLPLYSE